MPFFETTVRYAGRCRMCGKTIEVGERANVMKGRGMFHIYSCKERRMSGRSQAFVGEYGAGENRYVAADPDVRRDLA